MVKWVPHIQAKAWGLWLLQLVLVDHNGKKKEIEIDANSPSLHWTTDVEIFLKFLRLSHFLQVCMLFLFFFWFVPLI